MLRAVFEPDDIELRERYCAALMDAAGKNPNVVCVDVDTSTSVGTKPFYAKFPERALDCGIMEANAVGLCAGLSAQGFVPFLHAFGVFASRRAYDQVFLSCAYQDLNVKLIGADPGVSAAVNGGTHMPFEDAGILRNVPGMTIFEPADGAMLPYAVSHMANTYGNFYMRLFRKNAMRVYGDEAHFEIGRANWLRDGDGVAIIASGIMVYEALKAAELLSGEGISAAVLDMHTLKPIDADAIVEAARRCGAVVTAENHSILNGLGSAVAEVLGERCPVPLERVGVRDTFGEVGTVEYLKGKFGLTARDICAKAKLAVGRKGTI